MSEKSLKILFYGLLTALLITMLVVSRDAGISGDEEVHYKQSEMVYNYYKTLGKDKSCLYTPQTHLQYYGQSFDNMVTILIHLFDIDDVYGFRHLMNSLAGWLTILISGLLAAYFGGYRAGIITVLLFAVSPRFLGDSQNNLKDIPFALAYIAGTFLSLKIVFSGPKPSMKIIALLMLSIAASIGIRAGGILLVCYLFFLTFLYFFNQYVTQGKLDRQELKSKFLQVVLVSVLGYFAGLLLWPYALQNPIVNPWQSYQIMTNFPTTLRQIFNGGYYWSDYLPWFYLPKYMLVTIPLLVLAGVLAFIVFSVKIFHKNNYLPLAFLIFSVVFPIGFVIFKHANLYGGWRHFTFIYPGLIILSALGFQAFFSLFKKKFGKIVLGLAMAALAFHPLRFMAVNHPFYYLYFNETVGGLHGAYGKYETDYYYHSMRKGSEWLINHLKEVKPKRNIRVGGNFPIQWFFRFYPNIDFSYFQYANRSDANWDYAIVCNSYIHPDELKNGNWPPANAIHTIYVEGVPVCTVLKRQTYDDYKGIEALDKHDLPEAERLLSSALRIDPQNELIRYKLAKALLEEGKTDDALTVLNESMQSHPEYEPVLMLLAEVAEQRGNSEEAVKYYQKVIATNRKYFAAYIKLANLQRKTDEDGARELLRTCLRINPGYKDAILALASTYDASKPDVAQKYRDLANSIN